MTIDPAKDSQRCPACGANNDCAIARGAEYCWCMNDVPVLPVPQSDDLRCYCRTCLNQYRQLQKSPSPR